MKALILTVFILFSCTRYADLSRGSMGIEIQPVTMEVSHLNAIDWRVGMNKEEKVSQSITFIIDMPKVREEDLKFLTENKNVDAWMVRLIVSRNSKVQDLGSLYTLFKPKKNTRTAQGGSHASSVTIKVYYAAAYASERFRAMKCPAFGHDKKISSMSIKGSNEDFSLSVSQSLTYQEKSQHVELTPSAFNGGNSLVGEYYIEIAPYDSKQKMIHADFKRIPQYVVVNGERPVRVRSCDGVLMENQ